MRWQQVLSTGIVCAIAAGVAGCSWGDSPEDPFESKSGSPSWTPVPTSPKPELPEQEFSDGGAKAMVRYVIELRDYAYATSDAGGFEGLCTKECVFCEEIITDAEVLAERSLRVHGDDTDVLDIGALNITDTVYLVEATLRQGASTTRDVNGKILRSEPVLKAFAAVALIWVDGRWKIREFGADKLTEGTSS